MKKAFFLFLIILAIGATCPQQNKKGPKTGCVSGSCSDGYGTFVFSGREKYEGEFRDGRFNGTGTYTYSDGTRYAGQWVDGDRDGRGILYKADGAIEQQGRWYYDNYVGE
jgi:hypothetical protein